ncbi:MAG: hypothetical protein DMF58_19095 [Acidobacteria bacterium]|nr:MAG: hypothetical protein DMF58_19095 [Acidobacteriota bacterium]
MRRLHIALFVWLFATAAAVAQNSRSAVSINGSDLNTCTLVAPCRTFSVALSHTNPGGEAIALDSAGYGQFTANQAVTVSGAPGVHAALMGTSGNGVTVVAAPSDAVVLRNLVILAGSGAVNGIEVASAGSVHVINCLIRGFSSHAAVSVDGFGAETLIDHLVAEDNATGVTINTSALVRVRITNSELDDNSAAGVDAQNDVRAVVSDTSLSGNGIGVRVQSTLATTADVTLDHCIISGNGIGIFASNPDINLRAVVRLYGNVISYNIGAGISLSAATAYTYGNNALSANNPDGGPLIPLAQQ